MIGEGTSVGPYSIIGAQVKIGRGCFIGPHVVIEGQTTVGDENQIFQFASVGARPQDKKYHGEPSTLEIGDRNVIREFVTMQPGTEGGGMRTVIGSGNLFMANCHIGHDVRLGSDNVIANSAAIAGHVVVGDRVTVGGLVGVHQFVRIGSVAILGAGAMVAQDIPPYCIAQGDRARLVGINQTGLERAGVGTEEIMILRRVFRQLFHGEQATPGVREVFAERLKRLSASEFRNSPAASVFLEFIRSSERGIAAVRDSTED